MKIKAVALLFFGIACSVSGNPPPTFQGLDRRAVIVRIDGKDVTKGDVLREAKVFVTLNMNKKRRTKMQRNENAFFRRWCVEGADLAVNRAVVGRYAREHGLANSTNLLNQVTRQIERRYGVKSKKLKRWHSFNDLKFMLGKNASLLDAEVSARATYQTVTNHIVSANPIIITPEMIAKRISSIERYNQRMAGTNALVYARATNVWRRIVAKELTFEQAATNYSEDVYIADGCEWGTFGSDQLADDPAVLKMLPTLKVGDITPPVESDGGLAIVRLDEILEKKYTFSRVFFRLPVFFDLETSDQARCRLREDATQALIKRELDATKAMMRIEYPNGTNLFEKGSAPLKITKGDLAD